MMTGVEGFMYPNEVELQWSVLIVLYPVHHRTGGRRVHPGFARARLQRRGGEAHLPAGAADGAGFPAGGAAAAAAAPGPPGAFLRDVPDAAPSSAMAMFGFVYLWYLMVVLVLEIWLDYRQDIVLLSQSTTWLEAAASTGR